MPILASARPQTGGGTGAPVVVVPVDDRRLDFRSVDQRTAVQWNASARRELVVLDTATGLDAPPRQVFRDVVPGLDGARLRHIRTAEREVFLPLLVRSLDLDWTWVQAKLAEIRALQDYRLADYADNEGTFDLVAYSRGQVRTLRCTYLEGLEGNYDSSTTLPHLRMFGLKLLAVDPYWKGDQWTTRDVALPAADPFLSSNPADAFPRRITASVAIGADMPLTIPGDVPSPAVVELQGPASSTTITSPAGLNVTIGALAVGDTFVLDTGRTKRAELNGVSDWSLVGQSPQWKPLAPGRTTISVAMADATAASRARVHGTAMWETAW